MATISQASPTRDNTHLLPRWIVFVQDNFFLTCLLLAEAYLLGTLMSYGWVSNINDPLTWGWYQAIGVCLFFAAGACGAGVALSCSVKVGACLARNQWGVAFINLLGLVVFSLVEVWASLSERSSNLHSTPADNAVLSLLHIPNSPISPTVVMVAVFFPFVTVFYGLSREKQREESPEELVFRQERERLAAIHRGEMLKIRARNAKGAWKTFRAQEDEDDDGLSAETRDISSGNHGGFPGEIEGVIADAENDLAASFSPVIQAKNGNIPRDKMTGSQLKAWVKDELHVTITMTEAVNIIKGQPDAFQVEGSPGKPWAASRSRLQTAARRRWGKAPRAEKEPILVAAD